MNVAACEQAVVDAANSTGVRTVDVNLGCFVAGTLVHSKEGFKPIELVSVGDHVLSQPERKGEQSYQRVVNTFEFEEKQVYLVNIFAPNHSGNNVDSYCVTGNHPFWVKDVGWTRADALGQQDLVELADGSKGVVFCAERLLRTADPDVAWVWRLTPNASEGYLVKFKPKSFEISWGGAAVYPMGHLVDEHGNIDESAYFKRKVCNLEVANTHTYYVGKLGTWVHNTNCGDVKVAFADPNVHQ